MNTRLHWLNFARGVVNAQKLAERITDPAFKTIWVRSQHYWRQRVFDVLDPLFESYPVEYYGYGDPAEIGKNFARTPGERDPLSEPSLVVVYRWVREWPDDVLLDIPRTLQFTPDEIGNAELFDPRGLARYLRILRGESPAPPPLPNAK
jgi:hypothetical protein